MKNQASFVSIDFICTCQLARRIWRELAGHKLDTLAPHIGHKLNHHHAEAVERLLFTMKQVNATTPRELLETDAVDMNRFL